MDTRTLAALFKAFSTKSYDFLGTHNAQDIRDVMGEAIDVAPDWEALVFFIDLNPDANWAHECMYLFIDTLSNQYAFCKAEWPPSDRFYEDKVIT